MNLLLLDSTDLIAPGKVVIAGRRFLQLRDVIKPAAGDKLRCGMSGGKTGSAPLRTSASM